MPKDRKSILIISLVIVVVVLLGILTFVFLVNPALNGLVVQGQNQGIQYAVYSIAQQAVTCQQVPLTVGNQTINIIDVDCLKQK